MADLKDDRDGRTRTSTTQAVPATETEQTIVDKDEKEKPDATAKPNMPPTGGYTELRSEEEEPRDLSYQDKEDDAEVELQPTQSPLHGGPSAGAVPPGEDGRVGGEGGDVPPHEYKVYKRRWFGLVQLTLLNIIVSWDVSTIPFFLLAAFPLKSCPRHTHC